MEKRVRLCQREQGRALHAVRSAQRVALHVAHEATRGLGRRLGVEALAALLREQAARHVKATVGDLSHGAALLLVSLAQRVEARGEVNHGALNQREGALCASPVPAALVLYAPSHCPPPSRWGRTRGP